MNEQCKNSNYLQQIFQDGKLCEYYDYIIIFNFCEVPQVNIKNELFLDLMPRPPGINAIGWVSEWMTEWVSKWVNEWMSKWVSEWINQSVRQSVSQSVSQLVSQ